MHEKYASKGLAVLSVSLDPAEEKEARERALKFLTARRATFPNLLLAEEAELWQAKFDLSAPPALFVFDRRGKWTRFVPETDEPINHAAVEKLIVELLAEKGP